MSTSDSSRSRRMLSSLFSAAGRKRNRAETDAETPDAAEHGEAGDNKRQRRYDATPWKPRSAARDAMASVSVTHREDSTSQLFAKARRGPRAREPTSGQRPVATAYKPRYAGRDAMLGFSVAQRDDVTAKIHANARRGSGAAGVVGTEYRRALSETGMSSVGLPGAGQGVFSSYGGRWLSTGSGGVTAENLKVRLWGRDAGHADSASLGAPSPKASAEDLRAVRRSQSALALGGNGMAPTFPWLGQPASRQDADLAAELRRMDGGDFDVAPFGRPRQPLRHAASQPGLVAQQPDAPPRLLRSVASSQTVRPYTYRADLTAGEISAEHVRMVAAETPHQPARPQRQSRTTSYADLTAQRRGPTRPLMPRASTTVAAVPVPGKGKEKAVEGLSVARQPASVAPVPAAPSSTRGGVPVASPGARDSRQQSLVITTGAEVNKGKSVPQGPSRPASEKEEPTSSSGSNGSCRSSLTSIAPVTTPPTPMSTKVAEANAEALSSFQRAPAEDTQMGIDGEQDGERRRDPIEELKEFLKRSLAF
ncbi:hypothetical protein B0A55_00526 [Friedmanniomyces simplex]|uniref:Uncharacterized protein n=1 Tax=Friedmanniomyces simplex TaxID=329884 RepID=A0A4U0XZP0_9PEZI|nr:hypothetical protein B0A55_00526 [Friedmanniomyces simplex]